MAVHSAEVLKRIALSGVMENCLGPIAAGIQVGLGLAILGLTSEIPEEYLPYIASGMLILAYCTAPLMQAKALTEKGLSNDWMLTSLYEGEKVISQNPKPDPAWVIWPNSIRCLTVGYLSNPVNWVAGVAGMSVDSRIHSANFMAQIAVGWGLTMFWSNVILSDRTQEFVDKADNIKRGIIEKCDSLKNLSARLLHSSSEPSVLWQRWLGMTLSRL